MIVGTASVIINMIFAPFLIFGWLTGAAFGVAGAAISSLIAVVVATVWLGTYFIKPSAFLHYVPADWTPDFPMWWQMLKIGLPAGAEFGLMAVYLFIVYVISRPFGSAAQAGFGIGLRVVQAGFMPVVALGFSVAPVAGQNFGARLGDRVKHTFTIAASLAVAVMFVWAVACYFGAAPMVALFTDDAGVIAVGTEYLRIVAWTFVGSGIIFVASSMFQAMGNTLPPLAASFARIVLVAVPAIMMSRMPGFQLTWIWYLSVGALVFQLVAVLVLLHREFRVRLVWPSSMAPSSATAGTP
jgi:Na+-driven multidrug efflux pump